jgi:hypothetical protein
LPPKQLGSCQPYSDSFSQTGSSSGKINFREINTSKIGPYSIWTSHKILFLTGAAACSVD